jgi:hypothetical protein
LRKRSSRTAKQQSSSFQYNVSEVLTGSKRFYSEVEKICYAVIMSARKLRQFFMAYTIRVLSDQSLHDIFRNRDSSGRISKWAIELSEHVVDFEKCSTIKSQILADFMAECTEPGFATERAVPEAPWLVYCDRAWGTLGAGATAILTSPSGIKLWHAVRLQFGNEADKCTNNIAEYEAIPLGLRKLWDIGVQSCILQMDFKVVAGQIEQKCIARKPTLEKDLSLVKRMEIFFRGFVVEYNE